MSAVELPADSAGDEATPDPVTHALNLARLGIAVLPVQADKRPAVGWGVTRATIDPQCIVDAFIDTGAPLVGAACGASGLLVVDIDRHPGGADGFESLAASDNKLTATWIHTSTSGNGLHAVYAAPDGPVSASKPLAGVDIKAGRGYIVWPQAAGVPTSRTEFAPAPAWAAAPRTVESGGEVSEEVVDEWIAGNSGVIDPRGSLAAALAALPPHGSAEWSNANLVPLANTVVRASVAEEGGALARNQFVAQYAAGEWATVQHRRDAERAFAKAIDAFGLPYPLRVASVVDITTGRAVAPSGDPQTPFRVLTRSDLRNRPRPEWLIGGLLQGSGVVVLAGEGGLGKSFLALDWAAHIATGNQWQERATRPGRVIYVAAEGIDYFDERLSAWEAHNAQLVPDDRLRYVEEGFNLSDGEAVAYMRQIVAADQIDLVILDTLSQLSAVESENDNAQLAAVMRAAKAIREVRPGCSVLIVHHTGKGAGGKVRGASAIRNNADAVIVARAKAGDTFGLSTRVEDDGKQKNGAGEYFGGLYLHEVGRSAVIDRERAADPDDLAIWAVLNHPGWHVVSEILTERGDESDSSRKRIVRRLGKLVDLGRVEREGSTRDSRYARSDALSDTA